MRILCLTDNYPLDQRRSVHHWIPRLIEEISHEIDLDVIAFFKPYTRIKNFIRGDFFITKRWMQMWLRIWHVQKPISVNLHTVLYAALPGYMGYERHQMRVLKAGLSRCMKIHRNRPFDAILSLWAYPCGRLALKLGEQCNVPVIIANNEGLDLFQETKSEFYRSIRNVIEKADAIIVQSSWQREEVLRHIRRDNIHIVPLATELPKDEVVDRIASSETRIITVCRLEEETKNVTLVIHAIASLHEEGFPCSLTIIGSGYSKRILFKLCRKLGIAEYVRFTGHLEHRLVIKELYHHDIFVLPSKYETFGLVYIEALACGMPIIGYNHVGVLSDIAEHQFVINLNNLDVKELARAIRDITYLKVPKTQVSNELRNIISKFYSWEEYRKNITRVFSQVVSVDKSIT